MNEPRIERETVQGVTLLGDFGRPGGVTFAFTERTGGVSQQPFASLNLGDLVGDDPAAVGENRSRALAALGAAPFAHNLVCPKQVHGDTVVLVDDGSPKGVRDAQERARDGADAVVCTATGVPVLLVYADCTPVVLVAKGGFAVVHSGWKGTMARIASKALELLCNETGTNPSDVNCYLGPHICGCDYEVSEELLASFKNEFGSMVEAGPRHLSMAAAIRETLVSAGVKPWRITDTGLSTGTERARFFSYREEGPVCGRHGALAWMAP